MIARRAHQRDWVLEDLIARKGRVSYHAGMAKLVRAEQRGGHRRCGAHMMGREDATLLFGSRIPNANLEEESIELGLGQRVGSLLLDRVLRCEHGEPFAERV